MQPNSSQRKTSRDGVVLIAVLVCIGVATMILLAAVQKSLDCRKQLRNEAQLEQTRWLVDAGIRKAIANLEQRPDFTGQRYLVSPEISKFDATVEIEVKRDKASPSKRRVLVTAVLGDKDDDLSKMKRTKELVFEAR